MCEEEFECLSTKCQSEDDDRVCEDCVEEDEYYDDDNLDHDYSMDYNYDEPDRDEP